MKDLSLINKLKIFYKYHIAINPTSSPIPAETELGLIPLDLDLEEYYSQLLKYSKLFNIQEIESIIYNSNKLPIYSIKTSSKPSNKNLLLTAGIHGNEYAGLLAVLEILEDIKANPQKYEKVNLNIITPINPVGVLELSRYNASGKDINRDFHRFETLEAKAVRSELKKFKPDFVIDLHEGPQDDGTFIYTHQKVKKKATEFLFNYLNEKKALLAERDYLGRKLKTKGHAKLGSIFGILEKLWENILGKKPFASYATSEGIPAITIESSWRTKSKAERVKAHVLTIDAIVEVLKQ